MKKGFTLIEIIISISLILIIGIITTSIIVNNKNNSNLESITKQVLEAANLFVNKEIDEHGYTYKNGILNGAKGVQLSVQNLVDKGYLEESLAKALETETKDDSSSLYVLAAVNIYENNKSLCGDGLINFTPKWDIDSDDPIYLCEYNTVVAGGNSESLLVKLINDYSRKSFNNGAEIVSAYNKGGEDGLEPCLDLLNVSDSSFWNYSSSYERVNLGTLSQDPFTPAIRVNLEIWPNDNGLFLEASSYPKPYTDYLYYRGDVSNNYVSLNSKIWRIMGIKLLSNKLRLVQEDSISINNLNNIDTELLEYKLDVLKLSKGDIFKLTSRDLIYSGVYIHDKIEKTIYVNTNTSDKFEITNSKESGSWNIGFKNSICHPYASNSSATPCFHSYYNYTYLLSGGSSLFVDDYFDENVSNDELKLYISSSKIPARGFISEINDASLFEEYKNVIRPVIEVDIADVKWSGAGTKTNPYILELSTN